MSSTDSYALASGSVFTDDYRWQLAGVERERPAIAVDAFLSVFGHKTSLVHEGSPLAVVRL